MPVLTKVIPQHWCLTHLDFFMWHCFLFSLLLRYSQHFFTVNQRPEEETGQCDMASRGGATRPNGPNAGNKICQFKLVLLGESAVGKSSLVLRFVKGQFHEFQESTIGGMCPHKTMSWLCFSEQACTTVCKDWYYRSTFTCLLVTEKLVMDHTLE